MNRDFLLELRESLQKILAQVNDKLSEPDEDVEAKWSPIGAVLKKNLERSRPKEESDRRSE